MSHNINNNKKKKKQPGQDLMVVRRVKEKQGFHSFFLLPRTLLET